MHARQFGLLGFALVSSAFAQQAVPTPAPMQAVARDANSCLWQGQVAVTNVDGSISLATNSYVELATGLNYFDSASGQWVPAVEQINLLPNGGAVANQAQHQVSFPADIGAGDVVLTMPDGTVLSTHPAGLAYFDGVKSVLIAQLTNSVGLLLGNTVTYTNCLIGTGSAFSASVRFTFTKAGLEQEVILPAEQLPDAPDVFGLSDSNSFLLVLSQFTNAPAPAVTTRQVTRAGLSADDDSVDWPSMSFGQGKSFLIGSNSPAIPSTKTWQVLDGGAPYLIEQTPYTLLNQLWQTLPKPQAALTPKRSLPIASLGLPHPPRRRLARANATAKPSGIKRLAQNAAAPSGLSLDYVILNGSLTNYTFASSQTYFISAPVYLYSSATFEPAVIKFTNNASINFEATSFSLTNTCAAYAPLLLLSKDDNSAGANITGSTGNPTNLYANPALNIATALSPISPIFASPAPNKPFPSNRPARFSTTPRSSIAATALPMPRAASACATSSWAMSPMFSVLLPIARWTPRTAPSPDPAAVAGSFSPITSLQPLLHQLRHRQLAAFLPGLWGSLRRHDQWFLRLFCHQLLWDFGDHGEQQPFPSGWGGQLLSGLRQFISECGSADG